MESSTMEAATAEAATAETAAKTAAMEATAMESAAEAPTGISRGRRKGTERGHRGEGNHRFTKHDNLLHNDVRVHKRCRRRIVAPRRAQRELRSARSGTMAEVTYYVALRCKDCSEVRGYP